MHLAFELIFDLLTLKELPPGLRWLSYIGLALTVLWIVLAVL